MKRAVITAAPLPDSALAELKQWLGINSTREDALLMRLLETALDLCESFTGVRPIEAVLEETWPARTTDWQFLSARPVSAVVAVDALSLGQVRTALPPERYAVDLDADGTGRFRVIDSGSAMRVVVRFSAGLSVDWDTLPDAIRHGAIRLAAHHHRSRETGSASMAPPAAVAAMWQPWRRMRLA